MAPKEDTWTRAHDLALLYLALAYGTDAELTDDELEAITSHLQPWRPDFALPDVQEVVIEAMAVFLEQDGAAEVARSIKSLTEVLSQEERERVMEDIVAIAEADGVLLSTERSLINTLARSWGLKSLKDELLARSTAVEPATEDWTLFHDLGLVYLVMAHSTDDDLSSPEIDAIIQRLGDWRTELTEEEVRAIIRSALRFYAQGPDEQALQRSVATIRNQLPVIQRLAALDDLVYIAEADGAVNEHERAMIGTLARAWGVSVRLNGNGMIRGSI